MRWIWIDAFTQFESGKFARAVKNITLAEEYLHDHSPGYPVMPPSLMIEGMAQTAGILVGEARQFQEKVILAKVQRAEFDDYGVPGDQIHYEAHVETLDESAGATRGAVYRNDRQIGRINLLFSHVDRAVAELKLPEHNFVFGEQFLSLLHAYRIDKSKRTS